MTSLWMTSPREIDVVYKNFKKKEKRGGPQLFLSAHLPKPRPPPVPFFFQTFLLLYLLSSFWRRKRIRFWSLPQQRRKKKIIFKKFLKMSKGSYHRAPFSRDQMLSLSLTRPFFKSSSIFSLLWNWNMFRFPYSYKVGLFTCNSNRLLLSLMSIAVVYSLYSIEEIFQQHQHHHHHLLSWEMLLPAALGEGWFGKCRYILFHGVLNSDGIKRCGIPSLRSASSSRPLC